MTPRNRNRLKLIGIAAIAVAPVLGSYLLYWFWAPDRFTNYGTLIAPRPVPTTSMTSVEGQPFSLQHLRGRWVFLSVDGGSCDPGCETKLWKMRQVRQAQGKELTRIERVMLLEDGKVPNEHLRSEYQGTWFVKGADASLKALLEAPASSRNHIYLIDPLGNLMLRFPEDADPKLMIKDVSRLLKYSRAG